MEGNTRGESRGIGSLLEKIDGPDVSLTLLLHSSLTVGLSSSGHGARRCNRLNGGFRVPSLGPIWNPGNWSQPNLSIFTNTFVRLSWYLSFIIAFRNPDFWIWIKRETNKGGLNYLICTATKGECYILFDSCEEGITGSVFDELIKLEWHISDGNMHMTMFLQWIGTPSEKETSTLTSKNHELWEIKTMWS